MSSCAFNDDCLTGGNFSGLGAGVAWSIEITFGIYSSSIVILCDVVSVISNGLTIFGRSSDCGSSTIRKAAALLVAVE